MAKCGPHALGGVCGLRWVVLYMYILSQGMLPVVLDTSSSMQLVAIGWPVLHGQGRWPWSGKVALAYMSSMCEEHVLVLGVWHIMCGAWPIV